VHRFKFNNIPDFQKILDDHEARVQKIADIFKPLRFPETCKKYQDTTQAKTLLASHNISSKKEWKEWFGNLMVD